MEEGENAQCEVSEWELREREERDETRRRDVEMGAEAVAEAQKTGVETIFLRFSFVFLFGISYVISLVCLQFLRHRPG